MAGPSQVSHALHEEPQRQCRSPSHDAKMLFDTMNILLKRDPSSSRATRCVEAWNPAQGRRKCCGADQNPQYRFEECSRSLGLWDATGCVKVGWFFEAEQEWKWDIAVAATIGISLPIDIADEGCPTPRPHQHEANGAGDDQPRPDAGMKNEEKEEHIEDLDAQNEGEQCAAEADQYAVTGLAQTSCTTKLVPRMLEYEMRRRRLPLESHLDRLRQGPAGPHPCGHRCVVLP